MPVSLSPLRRLRTFATVLAAGLALSVGATAAARTVQTAHGALQIQGTPQRVVALGDNALDASVALGVKPVGALASRGGTDIPAYLKREAGAVPTVGTVREPSLEAILALQPDLILAAPDLSGDMYAKLSLMAPTIVPPSGSFDPWQDALRTYAKALGREDEAEERLADIDARIAGLRERMPAGTQVSVVRWNPQGPMMMSSHLFVGQLLGALGLKPNELAAGITSRPHSDILSLENLSKADADWIFLATLNPDGRKALEDARRQPAFTRLTAVREQRVVSVDGQIWSSSSGVLAARHVLDDVERALLN